jgi:hypothetical protein
MNACTGYNRLHKCAIVLRYILSLLGRLLNVFISNLIYYGIPGG